MKEYSIKIIEHLSKNVLIEASNENEAIKNIKNLYDKGDIILYPEECDIDVEFECNKKNFF